MASRFPPRHKTTEGSRIKAAFVNKPRGGSLLLHREGKDVARSTNHNNLLGVSVVGQKGRRYRIVLTIVTLHDTSSYRTVVYFVNTKGTVCLNNPWVCTVSLDNGRRADNINLPTVIDFFIKVRNLIL